MKKLLIILILALLPCIQAAEYANASELSRRVYLDLLDRTPTVEEYYRAKKIIEEGKYASLVKELMTKEEYFNFNYEDVSGSTETGLRSNSYSI